MSSKSSKSNNYDDNFRGPNDAIDFFKKRDRVRTVDLKQATNARSLSWNCEGTMIGIGCENKGVYVGSLDDHYCRIKNTYVGFGEGQIESLEFTHKNPRIFATCSTDRTVRIWDTNVSKTHKRIDLKGLFSIILIKLFLEQLLYVTFDPEDRYIVCVGKLGNSSVISAIDIRTEEVHYNTVIKDDIFEIVFHPNGKYLFMTAEYGKLIILEFPSMKRYKTIQAHPPLSECQSIAISPDGNLIAVGASDACCSIWNISDMICIRMLDRLDYPVQSVSFSKCSNLLASGSEDSVIDIGWVKDGNEKIAEIPVASHCYDVAWNPKYYLLAYATAPIERDREPYTVRLFGCPGGESRRT